MKFWQKISIGIYRHPYLFLLALLTPPLGWFAVAYLGSLFALLANSFYSFDDFTMQISHHLSLANYANLFTPANLDSILRTFMMAIAVTIMSAILAFPLAYYIVRYTRGWQRGFFYVAVMLPMWAAYIIKIYAWTILLAQGSIIYWVTNTLGLSGFLKFLLSLPVIGGNSLTTSNLGRFMVFTYIWMPFMILPIQAALERIHPNLFQASADLGATSAQTFCHVILPLAFPGIVAGSIFTFSLTLGDYIIPNLVGPPGLFIGSMVYSLQGAVGNLPMAAAFTVVPIVIIVVYLLIARRLGAFNVL